LYVDHKPRKNRHYIFIWGWYKLRFMADRYSIPVEKYIPPNLRGLAQVLGLDDLSNTNPFVGFIRGRDAMSRGDYVDAAIETAAPVAGMGAARFFKQPAKEGLASLFGLGSLKADVGPQDVDLVAEADFATLASYDRPNVIKDMFLDDEFAADFLGEIRNPNDISDAAPMSDVAGVRNVIYQKTQDRLKELPETITVYRAGPLNDRDGISSFTLSPSYNPDLELPWNKDRGSPSLESFTVRKEDILGSPDIIREFGESEVLIRNSSIVPKYAAGGLVSGVGSLGKEFL
jgi:hypothetical protein